MTQRAWRSYLVVTAVLMAGFWAVPVPLWWSAAWNMLIAYVAVGVLVFAARRLPRGERAPWYLFAVAVFGNGSAILVNDYVYEVVGSDSYPSLADAFYLSFYPACLVALGLMIRRWPPRRILPALLDSATITAGISVLGWVYAIQPALDDPGYSTFGQLVRVAYPVGDIMLIAMTLLLVRSGASGDPLVRRWASAPPWIASALMTFLCGDLIWLILGDRTVPGLVDRGVDVVYLSTFALFGWAIKHARATGEQHASPVPPRPGTTLMLTLLAALLMAPAVMVAEISHGEFHHGMAIGICSAVMSVLVVTRLSQLLRQSERQSNQVRELSRRDELTGLPNRRAWTDELPKVLENARHFGNPVSVAMMDLDHFKSFNDAYGHPAGDRLLKEAAAAWHGGLRGSDILARYGGEEFIVLLPGADIEQALMVMERVLGMTPSAQTFSSGVATWDAEETSDELIARADAALYRAKRGGRNRVVAAGLDPGPTAAAQVQRA
ncbi:diguanylate cyclase [Micromonosporaceae bacterium Da 78-11]